jgi:hypothetical protein
MVLTPVTGTMKTAHHSCRSALWASALMIMLQWPTAVASQESAPVEPDKVKAAFLRNFAHYVTWPENTFADAHSPWRICILGKEPFVQILDKTLTGRTEQGRTFEILRIETLDELPACQIVYISFDDPSRRRAALAALKDQPVLTVGDAREFLREGGMIRFQTGERVELSINLDRTQAASLQIQTKMLEVSHEVLQNGVLRPLR